MNSFANTSKGRIISPPWRVLLTYLILGWFGVGAGVGAQAATITVALNYADLPVASPSGSAFSSGTGIVRLGAFYDVANSAFYSTSDLQDIWTPGTRAAYENLSGAFVTLGTINFNRPTAGHFRFSSTIYNSEVDINADLTVDLAGQQMFLFLEDAPSSSTAFAILAVNQVLTDGFLDPAFPTGEGLDTTFIGAIEVSNSSGSAFDTTILAGDVVSGQLRMEAVPAASGGPVLVGSSDITHFWENGPYSDPGVTATGSVTTVIRDADNNIVTDFSAMSATLGIYTATYSADGASVSRTIRVKLQNPSADSDNDGLSNLMEYVLGGSLAANDVSRKPSVRVSGNELILSFTARAGLTDATPVSLGFVGTASLASTFGPETLTKKTGVSQTGVAAGFEKQEWALSTSSASRKFVRIKVTLPTELSGA